MPSYAGYVSMATPDSLAPSLPRSSRALAWLRAQGRFSLAAMIECLLAYALAFTAAWARGQHHALAGGMAALLIAVAVYRLAIGSERRCIAYFALFALAVAAGVYVGVSVLRYERKQQLSQLLAADEQTQDKLLELERKSSPIAPIASGVRNASQTTPDNPLLSRIRRRMAIISARGKQMEFAAESGALIPPPLPKTPDDWTPTALPIEDRFATPITLHMEDGSLVDFMEVIEQSTGLHCEFETEIDATDHITCDFMRTDLDWIINTVSLIHGLKCAVDRQNGKLIFSRDKSK